MNIGLVVLALYTISLLAIAWYASKQDKKNIKDFATASSSLGIFVLTLTFSATYHSAYAFLGAAGFIYQNGVGWWENGIWTVFPGVLFWIIGRRFWLLGKTRGYISMAQICGTYGIDVAAVLQVRIHFIGIQVVYGRKCEAPGGGKALEIVVDAAVFDHGTYLYYVSADEHLQRGQAGWFHYPQRPGR